MIDFLLYRKVLNEETADDYFDYLMNEGLNAISWDSDGKEIAAEIENVNTTNRFNRQIENDDIENDYFEGDSFGSFITKFARRVEDEHLDTKTRRRILTIFANYCYHLAEMNDIDTNISPSYRKYAKWVNMNKEKKMNTPSFLKNLD